MRRKAQLPILQIYTRYILWVGCIFFGHYFSCTQLTPSQDLEHSKERGYCYGYIQLCKVSANFIIFTRKNDKGNKTTCVKQHSARMTTSISEFQHYVLNLQHLLLQIYWGNKLSLQKYYNRMSYTEGCSRFSLNVRKKMNFKYPFPLEKISSLKLCN